MTRIFIDGRNGTTGLRIDERLSAKPNVEILTLPDELRKDVKAKSEIMNEADVVFLCLPDAAAIEAAALVKNPRVKVIDTSTAHRTNPEWAYGFPELDGAFEEKILSSQKIAVPGCHASGFIALVYPLVKYGFITPNEFLSCTSLTGYSGGGKKMIAEYQDPARSASYAFPRAYALTQEHKHLKEMRAVCALTRAPVFIPVVGDFYSGMQVMVALPAAALQKGSIQEIRSLYRAHYQGEIVFYDESEENGFLNAGSMAGKDSMAIGVFGNEERIVLTARYDNLGKGASGAAVECLNIITGRDKKESLVL